MLRKGLAVIPEYGPAGHVSAHRYVNMLSHRGESPYRESTTKQVDVVKRLNGLSARAQPHVRREQGSSQGGYDGGP